MGNQYIFRWLPSNPSDEAMTYVVEDDTSDTPASLINDVILNTLSRQVWAGVIQIMGIVEEGKPVGQIVGSRLLYPSTYQTAYTNSIY